MTWVTQGWRIFYPESHLGASSGWSAVVSWECVTVQCLSTNFGFTFAAFHLFFLPRSSAGPQHRAGRIPQSPVTDPSHLPPPDSSADDVLELQLQQLTLAQFAVAAMEHAIPLLRTGRSGCGPPLGGRRSLFHHLLDWRLGAPQMHACFIPTFPCEHQRRALPRTLFILHSLFLSPSPPISEGPHVFRRTLELLCDAVALLGDSVCELVWDDCSLPGTELASVGSR